MNFTGGVVLGLLYVLPGIFFVFGLARLFNTKLPSPFDGQLSTGIVLALLATILMHSLGIFVFFYLRQCVRNAETRRWAGFFVAAGGLQVAKNNFCT